MLSTPSSEGGRGVRELAIAVRLLWNLFLLFTTPSLEGGRGVIFREIKNVVIASRFAVKLC
jgi:hypothetical protein